jgi:PAS domain S-box-containing protein
MNMPERTSPFVFDIDSMVDTVRESLLVLDGELRVRRASRSFYQTFLTAPEATEGRLVYELGNNQWNNPRLRQLLEEILPQQTSFDDFEVIHNFERIGTKVMLLNARRMQQDQNDTGLVLLAIEDITELRRLENERRELETQFTSLVRNVREHSIFTLDLDGRLTSWNREAQRILGYSEAEALGQHFSIIFTDDDRQQGVPAEELRTALEEGRAEDERWHIRKGGERFWALGIVTPLQDAAGTHTGFSKILRDMTERKRADEAIRLSHARFEALFDAAPIGIYVVAADMKIRQVNPKALPVFGGIPGLIGRDFAEVIHLLWPKAYGDEILARFRHTLETGETYFVGEHIEKRLDRDVLEYYQWQINRIVLQEGEYGVVCFFSDISAQVLTREALVRADRRKDEFLATLAHELRNPIAPLSNGLEIIRRSADRQKREETRDMMERQVRQLARLVDDLLDISRLTHNKLELRKAPISLWAVVQSAIDTARPQIEAAGHTLTITLPPTPVHLDGDLTRLAQVFWNLLNNSAKYTQPGGRISLVAEVEGDEAIVTVQDNGIGIPADAFSGLFEMFSQVDHSVSRSQGGLGLGLALVKRLTEAHGGSVQVRSDGPGQGSSFIVRLPIARGNAPAQKEQHHAGGSFISKHRILVVDDNRDVADSLAMLFSMNGNETRTAHDGLEAVAVAEAFRPDLIVLDLGMPKLDGYETCRRIRENEWGKNIVIVAATGWGQDEDRRRTKEAGFDHHLVKPVFDIDVLNRLLGK